MRGLQRRPRAGLSHPSRHRVLIATTAHEAHDQRIVAREAVSLADSGLDVVLIARGRLDEGVRGRITHVSLPAVASRAGRILRLQPRVMGQLLKLRPTVLHVHDPELIPIAVAAHLLGVVSIYDAHEDLIADIRSKEWIPDPLRPAVVGAARTLLFLARRLDANVAATESIAVGLRPDTAVVHNYPPLAELMDVAPDLDSSRVIYVGGLERVRGIAELVDAIERVPDVTLILGGSFSDPAYEAEVRRLPGWGGVDFRGWLSRAELSSALAESAAGIVPFLIVPNHLEALPTKLFEYMAAGLPVLATDLPAVTHLLDASRAGRTVPAGDPIAMAEGIRRLLSDRPELAEMGRRGRRAVAEQFNWERSAARLIALYDGLLEGR